TSVLGTGNGVAERHESARPAADATPAHSRTSPSAGERTRTSKGFRPTGPKPVAFANSATPAYPRIGGSPRRGWTSLNGAGGCVKPPRPPPPRPRQCQPPPPPPGPPLPPFAPPAPPARPPA